MLQIARSVKYAITQVRIIRLCLLLELNQATAEGGRDGLNTPQTNHGNVISDISKQ